MTFRRVAGTLATVILIAAGGFVGANLRHLVALAWPGMAGTLVANATGSLALGFVVYEARYTGLLSPRLYTLLTTGFLSSYTTYSTFILQTAGAPPLLVAGNVVGTYALGFVGAMAGRELAGVLRHRRGDPAAGGGD